MERNGRILAVGSSNADVILRVPRVPRPGESLLVGGRMLSPGGKGSNRAVALARLEADSAFCCRLGRDDDGRFLLSVFEREGIDTGAVQFDDAAGTGCAYIMLEDGGSNTILSYMGANDSYRAADVAKLARLLPSFGWLCMDLEFSLCAVEGLLSAARESGVRAVVDAGPARDLPLETFRGVYVLSPNETEAFGMTGIEIADGDSARAACRALYRSGCENVVLKWGENGALLFDGESFERFPAFAGAGPAVDTTAAGDCFTAALTWRLAQGDPLPAAIRCANAAAAIAVTRVGAIPSLPRRAEVEALLAAAR